MTENDGSYKHIFSHPEVVADLLRGFVHDETVPGSLAAYRPSQKHFVLDEGRVGEAELPAGENALAEIIRLESSPEPEALRKIGSRLTERLKDSRYDSLRRAMVVWINRVVLRRLIPGEAIPEASELQEIDNMLAERVVQWTEKWKQEGVQQGVQLGEIALLRKQLQRRFGPLPEAVAARIAAAEPEQLETWGLNLLDAASLEDVFNLN
jgi:hypothetical protein